MRDPIHCATKLRALGRACKRSVLAIAFVFAACGGGTAESGHDQTEPSEVDIEETGGDGSLVEDTGAADSSLAADSDTSQVPDSDAASEADSLETDTSEGEVDQDEVADEITVPALDADQDGVPDTDDQCPEGRRNWTSTPPTDHDGDGCRDEDEDNDDDNDGVLDEDDACPTGPLGWTSSPETDHDGDGCRDEDEDDDDDNDGIPDDLDECPRGANDWMSGIENDADGDGCRDADEDFDLDGDGVADDVDVCPGLFDPEQIDTRSPFGAGQGDLCAEPCREYVRYPTIEVAEVESSCDLWATGGPGGFHTFAWIRFIGGSPTYLSADYLPCSVIPYALSFLGVKRTDKSANNDYVCHIQSINVTSFEPRIPVRLEVSASGTLFSDLSGFSNLGVLVFPAGSPLQDVDNDGLQEPWNPQSHLWANATNRWTGYEFRVEVLRAVASVTGHSLRVYGPGNTAQSVALTPNGGLHVYLAGVGPSETSSRLRLFLGDQLSEDIELPSLANNQVVYVGEYFHEPQFFVQRKRCAVSNTLCASEADCPSGPCVFRTMTLNFTPRE